MCEEALTQSIPLCAQCAAPRSAPSKQNDGYQRELADRGNYVQGLFARAVVGSKATPPSLHATHLFPAEQQMTTAAEKQS
eukprot:1143360-Pelagomonas_calceolata.AAC.3